MKIFGYNLGIVDFIPPIFLRIRNKYRRRQDALKNIHDPIHPADPVPNSVKPQWIVDIGANVGHTAIAALKSFPNANLICFEPVKATFSELQTNLAPFHEKVILFNTALSSKSGTASINITTSSGANSIESQAPYHQFFNPTIREYATEEIETVRLDDIYKAFPSKNIDIVKIDVEGHEIELLKGGAEFFSNFVDTIIIEVSFQRDTSWDNQLSLQIFNLLNDYGFSLINIFDVYNADSSQDMMVTQIDCVFRHRTKLPGISLDNGNI